MQVSSTTSGLSLLIHAISIVEAKPPPMAPLAATMPTHSSKEEDLIEIKVNFDGQTAWFRAKRSLRLASIQQAVCRRFGCEVKLVYQGSRPPDCGITLRELGVRNGDEVDAFLEQTGGKPVIYLFSPEDIDATVALSLVPEWRFSALYPVVPVKHQDSGHEKTHWDIRTHSDGSLTEKITGLDVSYLFWEAHTNSEAPPSPPQSPILGKSSAIERFSPITSDLNDADSVVLSVNIMTPYLDKVLSALGLHTEARTSFITYWLPSLLKHKYVALRFLPQSAYERAAPIEVSPQPDIVTRIFMLFKGVPEDRLHDWPDARAKAEDGVDWWKGVVGVDLERALDTTLFRVLEWGGMEILRG